MKGMYENLFDNCNEPCKVTVPLPNEIGQGPFLPTDYCVATGVTCYDWIEKDGGGGMSGCFWTRKASDDESVLMVGRANTMHGVYTNNVNVGVLPRIENPKESGISVVRKDGKNYLLINKKMALYPQAKTTEEITEAMFELLRKGELEWIDGGYSISDATKSGERDAPFEEQRNKWCKYDGKVYSYVESAKIYDFDNKFRNRTRCHKGQGYFFELQPIEVEVRDDGTIQCKEILATMKFEQSKKFAERNFKENEVLDTDEFLIGTFLNDYFLKELVKSTQLLYEEKKLEKKNETFNFKRDILGKE